MLSMLPKNALSTVYSGLRDYVEWLLEEKGDAESVSEFRDHLLNAEALLKRRVESGEISEEEADMKRGGWIWWIAFEESHEAPSFIAINRTFREDVFAALAKEPAAIIAKLNQTHEEAEREMAERLKQHVNLDDAE